MAILSQISGNLNLQGQGIISSDNSARIYLTDVNLQNPIVGISVNPVSNTNSAETAIAYSPVSMSISQLGNGFSWGSPVYFPNTVNDLASNIAAGQLSIITVGPNGNITTTTDRGTSFSVTQPVPGANLNAIVIPPVSFTTQPIMTVGSNGTVLTTQNIGSTSWTVANTGITNTDNLKSVAYGSNTYVAVGANVIYTSTNGGTTWTGGAAVTHDNITIQEINDIAYNGFTNTFWAVGNAGVVYQSRTGVTGTWATAVSNTTANLTNVTFTDSILTITAGIGQNTLPTFFTKTGLQPITQITNTLYGLNLTYAAYGFGKSLLGSSDGEITLVQPQNNPYGYNSVDSIYPQFWYNNRGYAVRNTPQSVAANSSVFIGANLSTYITGVLGDGWQALDYNWIANANSAVLSNIATWLNDPLQAPYQLPTPDPITGVYSGTTGFNQMAFLGVANNFANNYVASYHAGNVPVGYVGNIGLAGNTWDIASVSNTAQFPIMCVKEMAANLVIAQTGATVTTITNSDGTRDIVYTWNTPGNQPTNTLTISQNAYGAAWSNNSYDLLLVGAGGGARGGNGGGGAGGGGVINLTSLSMPSAYDQYSNRDTRLILVPVGDSTGTQTWGNATYFYDPYNSVAPLGGIYYAAGGGAPGGNSFFNNSEITTTLYRNNFSSLGNFYNFAVNSSAFVSGTVAWQSNTGNNQSFNFQLANGFVLVANISPSAGNYVTARGNTYIASVTNDNVQIANYFSNTSNITFNIFSQNGYDAQDPNLNIDTETYSVFGGGGGAAANIFLLNNNQFGGNGSYPGGNIAAFSTNSISYFTAGGGGAGGAGGDANLTTPGTGGIGILSNITGTPTYYGGGGSGAANIANIRTYGVPGLGGGGTGLTGNPGNLRILIAGGGGGGANGNIIINSNGNIITNYFNGGGGGFGGNVVEQVRANITTGIYRITVGRGGSTGTNGTDSNISFNSSNIVVAAGGLPGNSTRNLGGNGASGTALLSINGGNGYASEIYLSNTFILGAGGGAGGSGGNTFVSLGIFGALPNAATSPNGLTWTLRSIAPPTGGANSTWNAVTYGANIFAAVAGTTSLYPASSTNGVYWDRNSLAGGLTLNWTAIAYGANTFVTVASSTSSVANALATSTDGIAWTRYNNKIPNYPWQTLAYGANTFVAIAGNTTSTRAATSPDGITWTEQTLPITVNNSTDVSVTYGANTFVFVVSGSNVATTSPDGITWTQQTLPISTTWTAIAYGANTFVVTTTNNNITATSSDGITWTQRTLPQTAAWESITYGAGRFVTVARNGSAGNVATSLNGINWTVGAMPIVQEWRGVAYADVDNYSGGSGGGNGAVIIGGVTPGGDGGSYPTYNGSNATTAGSGGGGGFGRESFPIGIGGSGANGVVVISYTTGVVVATGGTISYQGSNTIHTFTSNGTFNVTYVYNTPYQLNGANGLGGGAGGGGVSAGIASNARGGSGIAVFRYRDPTS